MPIDQPNDAPDNLRPADRETAASVLNDETLDRTPGGGGLGGASAADPLGGSARGTGGPGSSAPMPDADVAGAPEREAAVQSLDQITTRGAPQKQG